MRLIDADTFKAYILDGFEGYKQEIQPKCNEIAKNIIDAFLKDIDEQPTVYDIDNVVFELKRRAEAANDEMVSAGDRWKYLDGKEDGLREAICIVRAGIQNTD